MAVNGSSQPLVGCDVGPGFGCVEANMGVVDGEGGGCGGVWE